jgi:hypothetical protein
MAKEEEEEVRRDLDMGKGCCGTGKGKGRNADMVRFKGLGMKRRGYCTKKDVL